MSVARSLGSIPPSRREMLNSERLPQTRQWSCGLSLTTSQSAHSTAFFREIAFKGRPLSARISTTEPFIDHPHRPRINSTECTKPRKEKKGCVATRHRREPGWLRRKKLLDGAKNPPAGPFVSSFV
jgi:hypothetical protein